MYAATRPFCVLSVIVLLVMGASVVWAVAPAHRINIPLAGALDDEEKPEVTDRVARVSFIEGVAKVRRAENDEWEAVTLNLPLVEGDELATEAGTRIELQFGKNQFLRLAANSMLKITTLRDEGIAVSLSSGTLVAHLEGFDKGKSFFEVDAPKTTVAAEKSGTFRIDAGNSVGQEVIVAATDGGEAHVYSETAGFMLRNGRTARIAIVGDSDGEWQTGDASSSSDEFDMWSAGRDRMVAERIKQAYYDKYYDDDVYGADDLNDYGEWVNTKNYGWVWRPDRSAISVYADWSPYRYGRWRWMAPYGWIWVNDEPWGWATYHHGRWVYDNGYWVWSPYGYYRPQRSWWYPALVAINVIDINITWYPISYHDHCHWDYWGHRGHGNGGHGGNGWNGGPSPTNVGNTKPNPGGRGRDGVRNLPSGGRIPKTPLEVPPGAVVGVETAEFVRGVRGGRRLPPNVIRAALEGAPEPGQLPGITNMIAGKLPADLRANAPRRVPADRTIAVGAGVQRQSGIPLDESLQKARVFGGREPKPAQRGEPRNDATVGGGGSRPTGAVQRDDHRELQARPISRPTGDGIKVPVDDGVRPAPVQRQPIQREPRSFPVGTQPRPQPQQEPRNEPRPQSQPRQEPKQDTPRPEPRQQPRQEPRTEPKREPAPPKPKDVEVREPKKDG